MWKNLNIKTENSKKHFRYLFEILTVAIQFTVTSLKHSSR